MMVTCSASLPPYCLIVFYSHPLAPAWLAGCPVLPPIAIIPQSYKCAVLCGRLPLLSVIHPHEPQCSTVVELPCTTISSGTARCPAVRTIMPAITTLTRCNGHSLARDGDCRCMAGTCVTHQCNKECDEYAHCLLAFRMSATKS